MTPEDRAALVEQVIRHEGLRLKPYLDTVGKITIGVGRNLSDRGIATAEAMRWLDEDIDLAIAELSRSFPWFSSLAPVRQRVLIDMHINLGLGALLRFVKMLSACGRGDYATAADEMLASKWATQVGKRAERLAAMMRTGQA